MGTSKIDLLPSLFQTKRGKCFKMNRQLNLSTLNSNSRCNPSSSDVRQSVGKVYGYKPPSTKHWFTITGNKVGLSPWDTALQIIGNSLTFCGNKCF